MKKSCFCNFLLGGVNLTEFGLMIPSPVSSLQISNSQVSSMTSWELSCIIGGDASKKVNAAAFEALLYSAAQSASNYAGSSGIPVSFMYGWLDSDGKVAEYSSYKGYTLQFDVSASGRYLTYKIQGYASLAIQSSMPVLRIPAVSGIVQPSAVVEGLAKAVKATNYYLLDIDHNDSPTLISHGPLTTSFNKYVRGDFSASDDYASFPGLLKLSKSYNSSRDAAGLLPGYKKLSTVLNNASASPVSSFLKKSLVDNTPQCASFSYWVDEPTMTQPGCIHYKSNAGLLTNRDSNTLEYGTSNTNVLSINGSYNGVAYNMTDMRFDQTGFTVDSSGNAIVTGSEVVNSWSSNLADVFQSVNIINDVNATASQFSGTFTVQIPGSVKEYSIAQPVSLLVMSGNTLSPISGVYNIISVSHTIASTFITTLKLQRLVMSSANQVATSQGIYVAGSSSYSRDSYTTTSNIISTHHVDFGTLYPDFTYMYTA